MYSSINIEKTIVQKQLLFLSLFVYLLLSACAEHRVVPTSGDAAPNKHVDVSKVPNAIPKNEPKSRYGNPESYVVFSKRYYVMENRSGFVEKGIASWYGTKFHGRRTSSGETYDMHAMTAAHKNLPLPSYVQVTNLNNGKQVIVKVNDRGPFHENRIIDLSYTAAIKLDIVKNGTGLVEIRVIEPGQSIVTSSGVGAPVSGSSVENTIDKTGFYIQVGSFGQLANAEKLQKKLNPLGEGLLNISQATVANETLYRVRIGPITDIDHSDSIISKLENYGVSEHRIVIK
ncbi:MAG TPA: septal ring lytic transglycosylase RlpA family protein [Thiotrichaceae bacterium]|jgi:rare lipoprotein A|nr:septal ring lytic transglycosylase RlpA family protein [Thiotrichaceae bacterium]HIM07932.1 septal ring lytic transglycosylase RlpA family protein [Gammaproteobacteria bacterium]